MSKYLKLFETHAEYTAYSGGGGEMILPNVSHCIDVNDVHYNPIVPPGPVIALYNIEDATQPTRLYGNVSPTSLFKKIEVDGVEVSIADLDTAYGEYQLSVGEHTVRYTLKNPTVIGQDAFSDCAFVSVTLDNAVTTIESYAFGFCDNLETINITDSITTIADYAFADCNNNSLNSDIVDTIRSYNENAFRWEK